LSFYQLVKKLGVILWGLHNLFRMVYSLWSIWEKVSEEEVIKTIKKNENWKVSRQ
jgi:hypothetical protein